MSSLSIDRVNKSYGTLDVLKDISIDIRSGEFLVLVGPSGCGKSTLLNAIAGISSVTSGKLLVEGRDITAAQPKDRDIAMVFQSYALYPNMSVRRNMGFALEMRGVPRRERDTTVEKIAAQLQLTDYLDRRPAQLSGGQRQRVAMGRALVRNPKVFLFDEPLSNLDAKLRVEMRTELKKLHHRLGATIVYVTHDQVEAMTLATRIVVMRKGVIQQIGTPKQVYDAPANVFVASFIGASPINLIPGRLIARERRVMVGDGAREKIALDLPSGTTLPAEDKDVLLGLRPEAITRHGGPTSGPGPFAPISAEVEVLEPTGPDTLVVLRWEGRELTARFGREADLAEGIEATFAVDMTQAVLFDAATEARLR